MKKLIIMITVIFISYPTLSENPVDLECLQGLWQRLSLRSQPNESFYAIYHKNNFIGIYTHQYTDSLKLNINLYKIGYINEDELDTINVEQILLNGKYYIVAEFPQNENKTVKILYSNQNYSISCDDEGYVESTSMDENSPREYIPIKIWNKLKYLNEKDFNYISMFDLEKYNPNVMLKSNSDIYRYNITKGSFTKYRKNEVETQVQVLDQKWNMLQIKSNNFEGWTDKNNIVGR